MKQSIRRIAALALAAALLLPVNARAAALFPRARAYAEQFVDVAPDSWYYAYAASGYEYGLFSGKDGGRFAPDADITVAELITLSARLRAAYEGDQIPDGAGQSWYAPYVEYLQGKGLLDEGITAYNVPATRAQLAAIFARSLPEDCYDGRNTELVTGAYASGGFIADVTEDTPYRAEILWLYRQGLLVGVDAVGSYHPSRTTTRAEAAAIVARIVDPAQRVTLTWTVPPYWTAAGTSYGDLVEAPASVPRAPSVSDSAAVDAVVRAMLAAEENTLTLRYARPLTSTDAVALAQTFTTRVKTYCEQMYNSVLCRTYSNGMATLTFSATACSDEKLADYRAATLARAIEVHDMLWETGQLSSDMSEYEIARVYFVWLCDNCSYDFEGMNDENSLSHIAYSALIRKSAVCDGYTGAYNLFLKLEGIDCTALCNDTHIWTVATLDGVEYHIDTTWGDQTGRVDMSFFGMTEAQSRAAHPW